MQVYDWTIELESPDGETTATIDSGTYSALRPSRWIWEARSDTAAAQLQITWPDAARFFSIWETYNMLGKGAQVVLKVEGLQRFFGNVYEVKPRYSAEDRSLTIICRDRLGAFKDACVVCERKQRVISEIQNLTRKAAGSSIWGSSVGTYPWAGDYLIQVWVGDPTGATTPRRVRLSEYEVLYEIGAIMFRYDRVRYVDDDTSGELLDDIQNDVYANIVYYDSTDTSTKVSEILKEAVETAQLSGGLGLTEGVDYTMEDTPSDKLNVMEWNTNEGDGDLISFIANLYDNKDIAMPPSYWIRDFNGNGIIEGKLVLQDNDSAKDIDMIFDAQFPSPLSSLYSRAVLINNAATRRNETREATLTVYGAPITEASQIGDEEYLRDGTSKHSFGWFSIKKFPLDHTLPIDKPMFKFDFGEEIPIEGIYYNAIFTFTGDEDADQTLHDPISGFDAVNGLYKIHEPQRLTVEWSNDDVNWFVISPDLYFSEVDHIASKDSWKETTGLNQKARYLRVVINNPMFAKVGESNWAGEAYRIVMWWLTEFIVLSKGRILDADGGIPEVSFVSDPGSAYRCRFDLSDDYVDMYRPKLLAKLAKIGLPWKTLIIEDDGVWDFQQKLDPNPDNVSLGYKLLVTRLDAASRENEWRVRIMPRPDILIGDTIYSSRVDPDTKYLIHGFQMEMDGDRLTHGVILSDHETFEGGTIGAAACP